jgi:hypothetical protein
MGKIIKADRVKRVAQQVVGNAKRATQKKIFVTDKQRKDPVISTLSSIADRQNTKISKSRKKVGKTLLKGAAVAAGVTAVAKYPKSKTAEARRKKYGKLWHV